MMELADMWVLEAHAERRAGSTPAESTKGDHIMDLSQDAQDELENLVPRLEEEINNLLNEGYTPDQLCIVYGQDGRHHVRPSNEEWT
jgi:hypothetical protein